MRRNRRRSKRGITIVEFVAALVLGLPLIIGMIYAALEVNLLFTIRTNLDVATRRAAQLLVTDYVKTGVFAADTSNGNLPAAYAFDVPAGNGQFYISHTANQFTWTWDLVSKPHTITVTTRFPTNGVNGLVRFPSPDPLHVGNGFTIITSGTFPVPATN